MHWYADDRIAHLPSHRRRPNWLRHEFDSRLTAQEVERNLPSECRLVEARLDQDRPHVARGRVEVFESAESRPVYGMSGIVGRTAPRRTPARFFDGDLGTNLHDYSNLVTPETDADLRARILDRLRFLIATNRRSFLDEDVSEVETATDEHLRSLGDLYGVERHEPAQLHVNVRMPGYVLAFEVSATFVTTEIKVATRYDRDDVV